MNYQERNNLVNRLALEAADDAKMEASYYGKAVTVSALKIAISCAFAMNGITFENDSANFQMETVVLKEISNIAPEVYKQAYPTIYYDVNGEMTYDSTKQA